MVGRKLLLSSGNRYRPKLYYNYKMQPSIVEASLARRFRKCNDQDIPKQVVISRMFWPKNRTVTGRVASDKVGPSNDAQVGLIIGYYINHAIETPTVDIKTQNYDKSCVVGSAGLD